MNTLMVFNECNKMSEMKMLYRRHVPVFHVRMTRGLGAKCSSFLHVQRWLETE
eukprot:COSAG06_NODE_3339_length_5482_cov_4.924091_3_plen_53_part_00